MTCNDECKIYDLVCSLGGNCAAAHNLQYRGLRIASYPFDWTYFNSDEAVYKLAEGFKDGFKNYMLKENLQEMPVNDAHSDKIQYEDEYGKIVWANHFLCKVDENGEYERVKEIYDRRFKRLVKSTETSKKILFVFSTSFDIGIDAFLYLSRILGECYPDKEIEIKIVSFDCKENSHIIVDNVEMYSYARKINEYDFIKTNQEWAILDKIKIKSKNRRKISLKLLGYRFRIEWSKS